MKEAEFQERLAAIRKDLDLIYNDVRTQSSPNIKTALHRIAANTNQIEEGITRYSRPKSWELITEGV